MTHHCNCGESHEEGDLGVQYSLHEKIDILNIECLNEYEEGSGASVFKTWEDRLDKSKYVESDADTDVNELLFNIPFTGSIKLKGLIVIGGENELHPHRVSLYKNRPHMTFDNIVQPEQEFELCVDNYGVHQYFPKVVKFSSVNHLSLYFTGRTGQEQIRIYYIGLKGEWTPAHQHGVTICTYELIPQKSKKVKDRRDVDRAVS
nr:PITH domain-containing protein CG6153 [Megalopta genalis]